MLLRATPGLGFGQYVRQDLAFVGLHGRSVRCLGRAARQGGRQGRRLAGCGCRPWRRIARWELGCATGLPLRVAPIARARLRCLRSAPRGPASGLAGDGLHADAIDRADGNAQLAAGAGGLQHGVHALVGADDGIDGAGFETQRAANAPLLVDDGHGAGGFLAVRCAQWPDRAARDFGQPAHALLPARRALVDGGLLKGDGVGVGLAIRVAATGALRLRQSRIQLLCLHGAGALGHGLKQGDVQTFPRGGWQGAVLQ